MITVADRIERLVSRRGGLTEADIADELFTNPYQQRVNQPADDLSKRADCVDKARAVAAILTHTILCKCALLRQPFFLDRERAKLSKWASTILAHIWRQFMSATSICCSWKNSMSRRRLRLGSQRKRAFLILNSMGLGTASPTQYGETDLLLRVKVEDQRAAILIENKVAAAEQDRQDERYHLRAARAQNEGKFDAFVTVMCAPSTYLQSLLPTSLYQAKVAYEEIEEWFARSDDPRSQWRRRIMAEAVAQGRRGYTMIVNEVVSNFHQEFWHYLNRHHPRLSMRRPTPKGNKSSWILFKGIGFPPNVGFHIKMDQHCVELGFNGCSIDDILGAKADWPEHIRVVQKGKTAALAISVLALDRMKSLQSQIVALESTMAAVEILLPYGHLLD